MPGGSNCKVGGAMFCATVTGSVVVQPFTVFSIVKVYWPGWFTVGLRVLAPDTIFPLLVVHWKVGAVPRLLPVAFNGTVGRTQDNRAGGGILATGGVIFCVMTTLSVCVQPF